MDFKVEKKNDALFIRHKGGVGTKWKHLFLSDTHTDSKHSDLKTLSKLMQQAVDDAAGIYIIGDLFDAMGHNFDKRTGKSDIKDRHQKSAYFNSIIDEAAEFLEPYARNIVLISKGNHEHSILKFHEFDLLSALKYKLYHITNGEADINIGDYYGWIKFMFVGESGSNKASKTAYYTHGSGGNATMSFGTLKVKRRQAIIDADIFLSGHIHQTYDVPLGKYVLTNNGNEKVREILHLSMGTFEDNTKWARANEFQPASKNGWWIEFTKEHNDVDMLEIRAK